MRRIISWILPFLILFHSCKKDTIITIDSNTAPPDKTIANVVKENYVNKVYISVLGRKPTINELSSGMAILNQHNVSVADRYQMLEDVFGKPGYNQRLYDINLSTLLNNLDTAQISQSITVYTFLLTQPQYSSIWPIFQLYIDQATKLKLAVHDLDNGSINHIELQKRCVYNEFYDQLNMGTENFVVSVFQHFFYRYPTNEELSQGKNMIDDFNGILFWTEGHSKEDFIRIFFASNNYFEGQVRDIYLRYLFREPKADEMSAATIAYKQSLDYKALQKNVLASDEYVGL